MKKQNIEYGKDDRVNVKEREMIMDKVIII
jgi:hypothetical protein